MSQKDFRARLQPKDINRALYILGPRDHTNILYPLYSTNGVLFPYTPTVTTGNVAEYSAAPFVHTNYSYNNYVRSAPKPININASFTAQTNDEAVYMLAVLHFFKSITKSYFGVTPYQRAGTPPPVLLFNYLGAFAFNNVPVIVKSFDYTYPNDVDYVAVNTHDRKIYTHQKGISITSKMSSNGYTYVPCVLNVNLELDTQYTPTTVRNEFNLDDFRSGKLANKGFI